MSFRWKDQKNQFGVSGMIDADWQRAVGQGTHATLSPFDMHNTLIAAGPDFKHAEVDDLPSGNVDLAPRSCRFSESNRRNNWMDESFRKLWLTTAMARPQGTVVSSPPHQR